MWVFLVVKQNKLTTAEIGIEVDVGGFIVENKGLILVIANNSCKVRFCH